MLRTISMIAIIAASIATTSAHCGPYPDIHNPKLVKRAYELFPWISQGRQRAEWIAQQESLEAQRASKEKIAKLRANSLSTTGRLPLANACDDGHWIEEVLADGQILELEDGSIWKVDPTDTPTSSVWLPVSDVVVCEDKIVNIDDSETVQVKRIR